VRDSVNTGDLKLGDVIEVGVDHSAVVRRAYRNRSANDAPQAEVLDNHGDESLWTDAFSSVPGLYLRVGEGCEPTLESLKKFVQALK
jgi:hypothetical protein